MDKEKDQYYFQGKYFDSYEDFLKYVEDWLHMPLTKEQFHFMAYQVMKDIWANIEMYEISITNGKMRELLEIVFTSCVRNLVSKPAPAFSSQASPPLESGSSASDSSSP